MAYDWVTTGDVSFYMFEHDYRMFMDNTGRLCKSETKKGRSWVCENTGEVIKIKCCTNNNTTGCGYCKIHNK
jgi:hypothetical protein